MSLVEAAASREGRLHRFTGSSVGESSRISVIYLMHTPGSRDVGQT